MTSTTIDPKTNPPNPKQRYGDKKPPTAYFPLSALIYGLQAFYDGKLKYGPYNWREIPVEAMTYVEAAMRHLQLYKVGENFTRDTRVHNLGAVIACAAILLDAELHGTLIDNRPLSQAEADLLHEAEKWVQELNELHRKRMMEMEAAKA